jgi:hypothetical protein
VVQSDNATEPCADHVAARAGAAAEGEVQHELRDLRRSSATGGRENWSEIERRACAAPHPTAPAARTCVVLPQPVSPLMTTTRFAAMT